MNFTTNLTKCVNHVSEYTKNTAIAATVGYGLTRAFTVLNPVAGATFFGSCALAVVVTDPVLNSNQSNATSKTIGKIAQFAFAWIATPYLTPFVTSTLSAITAELLSTATLIANSISLPTVSLPTVSLPTVSLPAISLPVISAPVIAVTALALVIIGAYIKKDKIKEYSQDFYARNIAEGQLYWTIADKCSSLKNKIFGNKNDGELND